MDPMASVQQVFIIDDHPLLRTGIAALVDLEDDMTVCGQAGSGEEALSMLRNLSPDIIIVDESLPGIDGIEFTRRILAKQPAVRVLMLSMHDEVLYGARAIKAGAKGYIMKKEGNEKTIEAIRHVLSGRLYTSERMAELILKGFAGDTLTDSPIDLLSDREMQVFRLLGEGKGTREIAEQLHLSVKTIEAHRSRIMKKLMVNGAPELIQRAVRWVTLQSM